MAANPVELVSNVDPENAVLDTLLPVCRPSGTKPISSAHAWGGGNGFCYRMNDTGTGWLLPAKDSCREHRKKNKQYGHRRNIANVGESPVAIPDPLEEVYGVGER